MRISARIAVVSLVALWLGWGSAALAATTVTVNGRKLTPQEQEAWLKRQKEEAEKHQLPPLKWLELEPGLAEAKGGGKPAAVLFCTREYKGAATFEGEALRKALTASGAVTIRVLPPEAPRVHAGATADEVRQLQEQFNATVKNYQATLARYGVTNGPALVFLTSDGEVLGSLVSPGDHDVSKVLANLPKTIEEFKAAKAAAEKARAGAGGGAGAGADKAGAAAGKPGG